jgi:hypothetical protein
MADILSPGARPSTIRRTPAPHITATPAAGTTGVISSSNSPSDDHHDDYTNDFTESKTSSIHNNTHQRLVAYLCSSLGEQISLILMSMSNKQNGRFQQRHVHRSIAYINGTSNSKSRYSIIIIFI